MIVQTRKELGGFHTIAQLLELRNMTSETIDKIADKVSIDHSLIEKKHVNRATAQELADHRYISFDLANRIVQDREASGKYHGIQDIVDRGLLDGELSTKLAPYLEFD
jgi:DNA uptake protein ComE-like DNA-binding protein